MRKFRGHTFRTLQLEPHETASGEHICRRSIHNKASGLLQLNYDYLLLLPTLTTISFAVSARSAAFMIYAQQANAKCKCPKRMMPISISYPKSAPRNNACSFLAPRSFLFTCRDTVHSRADACSLTLANCSQNSTDLSFAVLEGSQPGGSA